MNLTPRYVFLAILGTCGAWSAVSCSQSESSTGGGSERSENVGGASSEPCRSNSECDDGVFCNGEESCDPSHQDADAQGCLAGSEPCTKTQICREAAESCRTPCEVARDADGDGADALECGGTDCDDQDPNRFPGNVEFCDDEGHDEDCDERTFGFRDQDRDGVGDALCCNKTDKGEPLCGTDCDDQNATVSPQSTEACDQLDNDCDGEIDEGVQVILTQDRDGDGFGDAGRNAKKVEACPSSKQGYVDDASDCDDENSEVNPSALEYCDAGESPVDENCNGDANEDCACADEDVVSCCDTGIRTCNPLTGKFSEACSVGSTDEVCDGKDNDCDGLRDEGFECTLGSAPIECTTASGIPGERKCDSCTLLPCVAEEVCNGLDDDGDARPDEGFDCAAGSFGVPCVTQCGTQGTGVCGPECTVSQETCVSAGEACNYCDDNGVAGFLDEKPLLVALGATDADKAYHPFGCPEEEDDPGSASCVSTPGSGMDQTLWMQLLDGTQNFQSGTVWPLRGDVMGWGAVEIEFEIEVRGMGADYDADAPGNVTPAPRRGGFAVSLTGTSSGDGSRPITSSSKSVGFEWSWGRKDDFQPDNVGEPGGPPANYEASVETDAVLAFGGGHIIGTNGSGSVSIPYQPQAGDILGGDDWVSVPIYFRYTPDDPSTPLLDEEQLLVTRGKGGSTIVDLPDASRSNDLNYTPPNNDLPVGAPLSIAVGAHAAGIPYEARIRVLDQHIPTGPGDEYSETIRASVRRSRLCPSQLE